MDDACQRLRQLGFETILFEHEAIQSVAPGTPDTLSDEATTVDAMVRTCRDSGLAVMMDVYPPSEATPDSVHTWINSASDWLNKGITGVRCRDVARLSAEQWHQFRQMLRSCAPELLVVAWTPGLSREYVRQLRSVGFDGCFSSLAWWDQQSSWLIEEYEQLRHVAPVIAPPVIAGNGEVLDPRMIVDNTTLAQRLWLAAYMGQGLMIDIQSAFDPAVADVIRDVNHWLEQSGPRVGRLMLLSGPLTSNLLLYWSGGAPYALVLHGTSEGSLDSALRALRARLPDGFVVAGDPVQCVAMRNRAVSFVPVKPNVPVNARHTPPYDSTVAEPAVMPRGDKSRSQQMLQHAMDADRIVIDSVSPEVDGGRFAVKLILGRVLTVQATVFMDGHAHLAATLLWRAADQKQWQHVRMQPLGNDRWQAQCVPERMGRHYYTVLAEVESDGRHHLTKQCTVFPLQVERPESEFSSWYELFPRSLGHEGEHGRLLDVIAHLPRIRDMGFDVVYFPPIHPIGTTNRKGRNNSLTAEPGDPGSPYAIGSEAGGHEAIHPELGTLDDFRALLQATRNHDLDIALDFAIQCSPDHPWLREHPEWFRWREDGTVQYAENPPKRYEDIVNPDFYSSTAGIRQRMGLWRALRDAVLFWAEQGVRLFRVDNPHTKPLPFWEWMIAEVQRHHPDVVFLSEAFTRPAMMHRLAKLGFSQSYTYFTWRNTKDELTDYLTELSRAEPLRYFRPHFFVNTPDINPYFLQSSGRAGFLIRAALAATTSGLWGLYSGFELCEAQALPGKEEYQDSEKYELRPRDWNQAGNIVAEITQLNAIRRANPALQTHRGIEFHFVDDHRVLFFSKTADEGDNIVLVAISLSPRETVSVQLEIPAALLARGRDSVLRLRTLWDERVHRVTAGRLHVTLTPEQPFAFWSVLS